MSGPPIVSVRGLLRPDRKSIGRPMSLEADRGAEVVRRLQTGKSVSVVARALGTPRQTVTRVRDGVATQGGRPRAARIGGP